MAGLGFPLRFLRSFLGPTMEDFRSLEDPTREVPARSTNAVFRQVAGMNLGSARVNLVAEWNSGSSAFDISHQSEAWNVDEELSHPALERTSTGIYTYTLQESYPDETGTAVPTVIPASRVNTCQEIASLPGYVFGACWIDSNVIHIRLYTPAGVLVDAPFWLEAL